VHLFEELLQNPDKRVVIVGSEDLRDKPAARSQKECSQLAGPKSQLCLRERIDVPIFTNIWGTIVENYVCLPVFQMLSRKSLHNLENFSNQLKKD